MRVTKGGKTGKPRFVAGALGPTNRTDIDLARMFPIRDFAPPASTSCARPSGEQARGLLDGGADILLVETISGIDAGHEPSGMAGAGLILQGFADGERAEGAADGQALAGGEQDGGQDGEPVGHLPREARIHVVDVGNAKEPARRPGP